MTRESVHFERRVERIHMLLENQDAKVTWNDKVPDPDNPSRLRQIDITIRRGSHLTLVECRLHQSAQDVTWIEELIGRRSSLRASAVIAVSSSGFTDGATRKAAAYGIILRDFQTLTPEEISNWGKRRQVQLRFFEFKNAVLRLGLPVLPPHRPYVVTRNDGTTIDDWRGVFGLSKTKFCEAKEMSAQLDRGVALPGYVELISPFLVNGVRVHSAYMYALMRRTKRKVSTNAMVVYEDPLAATEKSHAVVSELDVGKSEIVEHGNRALMALDVSQLRVPKDSIFEAAEIMFNPPVALQGVQLVGLEAPRLYNLTMRVECYLQSQMPQPRWPEV